MGEKRLVPELRFSEYKEDWIIKKIQDVSTKVGSGKTPKGGEEVYQKEGIPFIRSQNVNNDELLLDDTHIPQEVHESMKGSQVLPNDILLNITGGSIGRSCVVPYSLKEANVNQHVSIIRLKKDNPKFLQSILSSWRGQKLIYQNQTGSGREGLNFESIKGFKIHFPSISEQQKIATFLTSVDQRIQLLEKKKRKLEAYKKGVMQQIFSQEVRFKDEKGDNFPDWEEKRLRDVCEKKSSNISANSLPKESGDFKIYGATGFLRYVDFFREEAPYISIVKDGAGVGRILLCDAKSSVLGTLDILKPKGDNDINFLYSLLSNIRFDKYITGSTIPHIYFKDYSKEKMLVPILPEQQKIAKFLSSIDKNIAQITQQIEKSKSFKKGLLQKMFV